MKRRVCLFLLFREALRFLFFWVSYAVGLLLSGYVCAVC